MSSTEQPNNLEQQKKQIGESLNSAEHLSNEVKALVQDVLQHIGTHPEEEQAPFLTQLKKELFESLAYEDQEEFKGDMLLLLQAVDRTKAIDRLKAVQEQIGPITARDPVLADALLNMLQRAVNARDKALSEALANKAMSILGLIKRMTVLEQSPIFTSLDNSTELFQTILRLGTLDRLVGQAGSAENVLGVVEQIISGRLVLEDQQKRELLMQMQDRFFNIERKTGNILLPQEQLLSTGGKKYGYAVNDLWKNYPSYDGKMYGVILQTIKADPERGKKLLIAYEAQKHGEGVLQVMLAQDSKREDGIKKLLDNMQMSPQQALEALKGVEQFLDPRLHGKLESIRQHFQGGGVVPVLAIQHLRDHHNDAHGAEVLVNRVGGLLEQEKVQAAMDPFVHQMLEVAQKNPLLRDHLLLVEGKVVMRPPFAEWSKEAQEVYTLMMHTLLQGEYQAEQSVLTAWREKMGNRESIEKKKRAILVLKAFRDVLAVVIPGYRNDPKELDAYMTDLTDFLLQGGRESLGGMLQDGISQGADQSRMNDASQKFLSDLRSLWSYSNTPGEAFESMKTAIDAADMIPDFATSEQMVQVIQSLEGAKDFSQDHIYSTFINRNPGRPEVIERLAFPAMQKYLAAQMKTASYKLSMEQKEEELKKDPSLRGHLIEKILATNALPPARSQILGQLVDQMMPSYRKALLEQYKYTDLYPTIIAGATNGDNGSKDPYVRAIAEHYNHEEANMVFSDLAEHIFVETAILAVSGGTVTLARGLALAATRAVVSRTVATGTSKALQTLLSNSVARQVASGLGRVGDTVFEGAVFHTTSDFLHREFLGQQSPDSWVEGVVSSSLMFGVIKSSNALFITQAAKRLNTTPELIQTALHGQGDMQLLTQFNLYVGQLITEGTAFTALGLTEHWAKTGVAPNFADLPKSFVDNLHTIAALRLGYKIAGVPAAFAKAAEVKDLVRTQALRESQPTQKNLSGDVEVHPIEQKKTELLETDHPAIATTSLASPAKEVQTHASPSREASKDPHSSDPSTYKKDLEELKAHPDEFLQNTPQGKERFINTITQLFRTVTLEDYELQFFLSNELPNLLLKADLKKEEQFVLGTEATLAILRNPELNTNFGLNMFTELEANMEGLTAYLHANIPKERFYEALELGTASAFNGHVPFSYFRWLNFLPELGFITEPELHKWVQEKLVPQYLSKKVAQIDAAGGDIFYEYSALLSYFKDGMAEADIRNYLVTHINRDLKGILIQGINNEGRGASPMGLFQELGVDEAALKNVLAEPEVGTALTNRLVFLFQEGAFDAIARMELFESHATGILARYNLKDQLKAPEVTAAFHKSIEKLIAEGQFSKVESFIDIPLVRESFSITHEEIWDRYLVSERGRQGLEKLSTPEFLEKFTLHFLKRLTKEAASEIYLKRMQALLEKGDTEGTLSLLYNRKVLGKLNMTYVELLFTLPAKHHETVLRGIESKARVILGRSALEDFLEFRESDRFDSFFPAETAFWDLINKSGFWKDADKQSLIEKLTNMTAERLALLKRGLNSPDPDVIEIKKMCILVEHIRRLSIPEVDRISNALIERLVSSADPEKALEEIERIFVQNHLPAFAKRFEVFKILYTKDIINGLLNRTESHFNGKASPAISKASHRRRVDIFFHDLLKSHLESQDTDLKEYLTFLKEGQPLLEKAHRDIRLLTVEELREMENLLDAYKTILGNTPFKGGSDIELRRQDLGAFIADLYQEFGVKDGQTLSDRCADLFARPLGFQDIDGLLQHMSEGLENAHRRNLQYVEATHGRISFQEGDFLKGAPEGVFEEIIDGGFVARDFLGGTAEHDQTPFDIDLAKVDKDLSNETMHKYLTETEAKNYGDVLFLIRPDETFIDTTNADIKFSKDTYDARKYEVFQSAVLGEFHYGIRTSLPNTKITAIVVKANVLQNPSSMQRMYFALAKKGLYIPIVDTTGRVVFSPEDFGHYTKMLQGVEKFSKESLRVEKKEFASTEPARGPADTEIPKTQAAIREKVAEILKKHGVEMRNGNSDRRLDRAGLQDIGSTGRGTNLPGDYDFDYALHIPARTFHDPALLQPLLHDILGFFGQPNPGEHAGETLNSKQFRFFGSTAFGQRPLDIDIALYSTNASIPYGTHEAITAKLDSIRREQGEGVYQQVLQEIHLAKHMLKEKEAYKKSADPKDTTITGGGLGGVGVEYLILNYGGTVKSAFREFFQAAHDSQGNRKSFESFQQSFFLMDPGKNLRNNRHDNFIRNNLREDKYKAMLDLIEAKFPEFKQVPIEGWTAITQELLNTPGSILGHGTVSRETAQKIMDGGIAVNQNYELPNIALPLNKDAQLQKTFENWTHRESKFIVIISAPAEFREKDIMDRQHSEELNKERTTIPRRFIKGYVDVERQVFISNPHFEKTPASTGYGKRWQEMQENGLKNRFNHLKDKEPQPEVEIQTGYTDEDFEAW